MIHDIQAGTDTVVYSTSAWPGSLIYSPDGSTVAFFESGTRLLDLATGQTTQLGGFLRTITPTPFSPDGQSLVFCELGPVAQRAEGAQLWRYDLATGQETLLSSTIGEFAAVFADNTSIYLLALTSSSTFDLKRRSLVDGSEEVLLAGLDRWDLPDPDRSNDNLYVTLTGRPFVSLGETLITVDSGGHFLFADTAMHQGWNQFQVRQEIAGIASDSEPIDIEALPGFLPDAEIAGLGAISAFPLSGEQVLIEALITNSGGDHLECPVLLERVPPGGGAEPVLQQTVFLDPGETATLRFTWDTTGLAGDYLWQVTADPLDQLLETDEENNWAEAWVAVREQRLVELGVTSDRTSYFAGQTVIAELDLMSNQAPQDLHLETRIEDESGALVAVADSRDLDAFGHATTRIQVSWSLASTYPGSYRIHATASNSAGTVAEALAPFVVLRQVFV
ncbi:MAG: hypothetical protein GY836_06825, partial [Herbaspirillum sp.]|uniref:CARDB domain-containing protein n=1 Tax=Herbaspirillum sp. TaxID=1890675 RepID=UPI00258EAD3D